MPTLVEGLLSDEGVVVESIAAGVDTFYILLSNGMLLACGDNTHGQLGIDSEDADSVDVPTAISNVSNVTDIFSGATSYAAFFVSDSEIYSVGYDGQQSGYRVEGWTVPQTCSYEETMLNKTVVISSSNDHSLYLVTLDCEAAAPIRLIPSRSPSISFAPSSNSTEEGSESSFVPTPFFVVLETSQAPTASSAPSPASAPSATPVSPPKGNFDKGVSAGQNSVGGLSLPSALTLIWLWF